MLYDYCDFVLTFKLSVDIVAYVFLVASCLLMLYVCFVIVW